MASGRRSKSATPATAPAEKPRIRWSLSRNRSAKNPPMKVAADAASAMSKTFIPATVPALLFQNRIDSRLESRVGDRAGNKLRTNNERGRRIHADLNRLCPIGVHRCLIGARIRLHIGGNLCDIDTADGC